MIFIAQTEDLFFLFENLQIYLYQDR